MNMTTNSPETMKDLGINPGAIHDYSDVSMEPISFTKESNLGWGTAWCAVHSATWDFNKSEIEVDGHTINMDNDKNQSFNALLEAWRKRMKEQEEA